MRKAIILAAGLGLLATSAFGQGSWRDRDDDDRRGWREDRRDGGRDRDEMRGRSMRDDDEGGSSRPARFLLRSGEARIAVRCDDRESMRACVDAALTLFDRVRTQQGTASTPAPANPGSSAPAAPAR
jgi:hypothetical protein